jgi:SMC interacting uncharacterized protein involved in chromosome segregation
MTKFEQTVAESFQLVKRDITQLQEGFLATDKTQELTLQTIERMHTDLQTHASQIEHLQKKLRDLSEQLLKMQVSSTQAENKLRKDFALKTSQLDKEKKALIKQLKIKTPLFVGNSKTKRLFIIEKETQIPKNERVYFYTKTQAKKAGFK